MAKLKLYLDTRSPRPDGKAQVKIAINHNSSPAYIGLGIYLKPSQ